jgi:selenocysteine lyase/cysteine desulfurase
MQRRLSRRGLLGAATLAGATGAVAACERDRAVPGAATAPPLDPKSWPSVRAQFALDPGLAHLSAYVFAPHPAVVRAAIERHRAGLDADPIGYLHQHEAGLDAAVASAAAGYLQTRPDWVAFTDSTTMGLGLLYGGLRLAAGDEVLTTEHDFYATHEALRLRAARDGVVVRGVSLYADPSTASVDEIVGRLVRALSGRTRVVAVTWVHSGTGVKLPIRAIADAVRARGREVLLCVDGVHGLGVEDASPEQLGCDFLVSGCHKWLFGPRGTGLIWGREPAWQRLVPVIPSFDRRSIGAWLGLTLESTPAGPAATPGGYHTFEHRWALAEAFAFHAAIGPDRVATRTRTLAGLLKDGLRGMSGVRLVTPGDPSVSAGVVCCEIDGVRPNEVVGRLRKQGVVASVTPYQRSYVRFGTTLINNEDDVDAALRGIRALA